MSIRHKKRIKYLAFTLLPVLLVALAALVPAIAATGESADALNASQWQTVAGAIDGYIASQVQYDAATGQYADDGEAGFLVKGGPYNAANPADSLKGRLDSNNDGVILGEGDDAANSPVLVDVFSGTFIPGTAHRFSNTNAADLANANLVADEVTQHRNAGFSTDIISYCLTGHTESPPVLAYGAMAQAGYFGSPAPKSLGLKWGRLGWGGSTAAPGYAAAGGTNATAATAGSNPLATNGACNGSTTPAELVRCTAADTLANIANTETIVDVNQVVDIRGSLTGGTVKTGGTVAIQNPLANLFDATGGSYDNLRKLDNSKTIVFINRTQHSAAFAATGARMLGYTNAKYFKWGLPKWNSANPPGWEEKFSVASRGYSYDFTSEAIDANAPIISGIAVAAGADSATITWSSNEPATSVVEYGESSSGPWTKINDTILHKAHSVVINGLAENKSYYYKVSSFDGLANGSTSAVTSFSTADVTAPQVAIDEPAGSTVYTDPFNIKAHYSDSGSGIKSSTVAVKIDGSPVSGCLANGSEVNCSAAGVAYGLHTLNVSVQDNAGNPARAEKQMSVGDNVAPVISDNKPVGTINSASPTISAAYSDAAPSSGIDSAAVAVYLDGSQLSGCTADDSKVECATSGLAAGNHNVKVAVPDQASPANAATKEWSFAIDMSTPTVTPAPANDYWTGDSTPELKANITDVPQGQNITQAEITIDGAACAPVAFDNSSMSCTPGAALTDGPHEVIYKAGFIAGKLGSGQHQVSVDTAKPEISNLQPQGQISTNKPIISADLSDADSGIDNAAVSVYLDGQPLPNCTVSADKVSCEATVGVGQHGYTVNAADQVGNSDSQQGQFELNQLNYYFSWYDNSTAGMNGDWIVIHNDGDGIANVKILIGETDDNAAAVAYLDAEHGNGLAPDQVVAWQAPAAINNGPVRVVSTNGQPLTVSQRVLYKSSFNEIWAVDESDLQPEYNFTWYDNNPEWGMNGDWILVSNQGDQDAAVNVYIGDDADPKATLPLGPGEHTAWTSPEVITDGPVRLVDANGGRLLASQRVVYKEAFNEVPGVPTTNASPRQMFTWYDNNSGWGMNGNWLLVVNKGSEATDVDIQVGQSSVGEVKNIPPGGVLYWQSPVIRVDGPVIVTSINNQPILASQRVIYKDSFEEVQGTSPDDMSSGGLFNWYDTNLSQGMIDWVLVGNEDDNASLDAYISIGGQFMASPATGETKYNIKPHTNVTPVFFDTTGGPVKVGCSNCDDKKVVVSQRVLYNGSFNELVAKPRKGNTIAPD